MKNLIVLLTFLISFILFAGCAVLEDLLDEIPANQGKKSEKTDKEQSDGSPFRSPEVLCTYFHYFKAGPASFDQWWIHGKDPGTIIGPEKWRRNIWIGRAGDYPYIGIYNNVNDGEIMRWHIRLAKAAGITAFLLYVNNWEGERAQTDLLLQIAQEEDFKIGFVEHHSFLGARSIRMLDGRPQPMLPQKYVGYHQLIEEHAQNLSIPLPSKNSRYIRPLSRTLRDVPIDALNRAIERISGMLKQWKSHPAYLRIDGKPIIVIPYMVKELIPGEFKQLVEAIKSNVSEDLYVVAIVADIYWYFYPEAVLTTGITKDWSESGADAFTHWTPNGMVDASQRLRRKVTQFHVKDSLKWRKDPMIPVMPGFEDDAWRPGDVPAPTSLRHNGRAWNVQLESILDAKPRFIFIQGWNEWHEGAQIEPSTNYSDPYLYLKILSQKLNRRWEKPPLPPKTSIDPLRLPYLDD